MLLKMFYSSAIAISIKEDGWVNPI